MEQQNDDLRNRFTAWMQVVVKRAKIDYVRQLNRYSNEVSIDDESLANRLIYEPNVQIKITEGFDFDNAKLSMAFKKLQTSRRRILELMYIRNMCPEEIAAKIGCTLQHVYNLHYLAIKELKSRLGK